MHSIKQVAISGSGKGIGKVLLQRFVRKDARVTASPTPQTEAKSARFVLRDVEKRMKSQP